MTRIQSAISSLCLFFTSFALKAEETVPAKDLLAASHLPAVSWEDATLFNSIKQGLSLTAESSWRQFTYPSSLATLGLGAGAVWAVDGYDVEWQGELADSKTLTNGVMSALGDEASIILGFTPLVSLYMARWMGDEKLYHFSVETFGSMALAWAETIALSQINYHVRPRDMGTDPADSFFDTAFRGRSSWPSGHLVAPFTLTLKVWDYYGWKAGLIPAGLTAIAAGNRIADGSHYPSDILASGVLSLAAHLATKKVKTRRDGFHFSAVPLGNGVMISAGRSF